MENQNTESCSVNVVVVFYILFNGLNWDKTGKVMPFIQLWNPESLKTQNQV